MQVGVPRELKDHEYRVAITPVGVRELTDAGHQVLVEHDAGTGSSIPDDDYVHVGAKIVAGPDELWANSDLVLKVKEPIPEEYPRLRSGQLLFTYLHLAANAELTRALCASGITAVAYETVQTEGGRLPLLAPMSEVAGRMAPQAGAHLLEREQGGRGVLMGGVSGVAPARVLVLLDTNVDKLRWVDAIHKGRILTLTSSRRTVEELVVNADLVIGAVLIPGARAPRLISREL